MGYFNLGIGYSSTDDNPYYSYRYEINYTEFAADANKNNIYEINSSSGIYYKKADGKETKFSSHNMSNPSTTNKVYLSGRGSFYLNELSKDVDINDIIEIYMKIVINIENTDITVDYTSNNIILKILDSNYKFNGISLNKIAANIDDINNNIYNYKNYSNDIDINNIKNIIDKDTVSSGMNYYGYNEYPNIRYIKKTDNFAGGLWGNDPVINVGINNTYLDKNGNPIPFTSRESVIFNGLDLNDKNTFLNIDRNNENNIETVKIKYDEIKKSTTVTLIDTYGNRYTNTNDIYIKNNIIVELVGSGGNGYNGYDYGNHYNNWYHNGGAGGNGGGYCALLINISKIKEIEIRRRNLYASNGSAQGQAIVLLYTVANTEKAICVCDGRGNNGLDFTQNYSINGVGLYINGVQYYSDGKLIYNINKNNINDLNSDDLKNEYIFIIRYIAGASGGAGGYFNDSSDRSIAGTAGTNININANIMYSSDVIIPKTNAYTGGNGGENTTSSCGGGGGGASAKSSGGNGGYYNNNSGAAAESYGGGGGGGAGKGSTANVGQGGKGGSWLIRVYAEKLDGSYDFSDIEWSYPTIPEI